MPRGTLRIYFGAGPGVGKTFAMLNEGRRRRSRGTDVVAVAVDPKGRSHTEEQLCGLEVLPARRGERGPEVDLARAQRRSPQVALVDDFAHTNAPGGENPKRWMDVEALLESGIDVVTTLNVQHLESLSDVVTTITGMTEPETIPDAVVRQADQIELIDVTPEALRRRMAHGNVYPPERIDGALSHYFRLENLGALRELALEWTADHADRRLAEYRTAGGVAEPWETRERVVVALTGASGGEHLLRRGARMAARTKAELVALHVRPGTGVRTSGGELERYRDLTVVLGGRFTTVTGGHVAESLVEFARAENATQLVLGATRRTRWRQRLGGSVVKRVLDQAGPIDVHVVSTGADESSPRPGTGRESALPARRRAIGWLLALVGTPLLVFALLPLRDGSSSLPTVLLVLLLACVAAAAVGGVKPGITAALVAAALANWYYVPPIHTWRIAHERDVAILVSFVLIAGVVSVLTDRLARRSLEAWRARAEASTLGRLVNRSVAQSSDALTDLVLQLGDTVPLLGVALLTPTDNGWALHSSAGARPPSRPDEADLVADLTAGSVLAVRGAQDLAAGDRRLLNAFAAQIRLSQQQVLLQADAASAGALAEANRLRTAMLAAVSHDLRTPLSSIKAAATSVLSDEVTWTPAAIRGFCETIDVEADRLNHLVGNLLDMSRLQGGVLTVGLRRIGLDEITFSAVHSLSRDTKRLDVAVSESLPPIIADPALLERAVANVIDNALNWAPEGACVRVAADAIAGHVELRVVDRGPGIPVAKRAAVFQPFQRLGDGPSAQQHGIGLGLAVARGFVASMGAELRLEDTPGGGLTAVFTFPLDEG
jgi:two-component system, OmpR family, sensor histidine kinase KdpD